MVHLKERDRHKEKKESKTYDSISKIIRIHPPNISLS
jgi:hypothetical protein